MIRFDPLCYILGAILILLLPLDWLLSTITAALIHESAHILAVRIFGGHVRSIRFSVSGCVIECDEMEPNFKIISILAGPSASLALLVLRRIFPQIAVCGLIQGLFNLLPVLPLDGGRILRLLLYRWIPSKADVLQNGIRYGVLFLIFCLIVWCMRMF